MALIGAFGSVSCVFVYSIFWPPEAAVVSSLVAKVAPVSSRRLLSPVWSLASPWQEQVSGVVGVVVGFGVAAGGAAIGVAAAFVTGAGAATGGAAVDRAALAAAWSCHAFSAASVSRSFLACCSSSRSGGAGPTSIEPAVGCAVASALSDRKVLNADLRTIFRHGEEANRR